MITREKALFIFRAVWKDFSRRNKFAARPGVPLRMSAHLEWEYFPYEDELRARVSA